MERHFYRCLSCLDAIAVDGPQLQGQWEHTTKGSFCVGPLCDCGGVLNHMGRVQGDRYIKVEERCACDSRCTSARGPQCDCVCGGANHGTGRTVRVIVEAGTVAIVAPRADLETRKARALEFEASKAGAMARIKSTDAAQRKARGEYVEYSAFTALTDLQTRYRKACKNQVHKARIKALTAIA